MIRVITTTFLIITIIYEIEATNYYISNSGNDDWPGTFEQPWKTIGKATGTITAGDTAFIRVGTYYENVNFANSGNSLEKIVLMAYEDEDIIMDGNNNATTLIYAQKNYIEINNINFQNTASWGVLFENSSNITIKNCEFRNIQLSGIRLITVSDVEVLENTIDSIGYDEHWGGGIWISVGRNIFVKNNHITNSGAYGIRTDQYSAQVYIESNYTYNTFHSGVAGFDTDTISIYDNEIVLACNGSYDECLSIEGGDYFLIYNNEVHTSGDVEQGAEGIAVGYGSINGKIYNNYIHDLDKTGLYVDGGDIHTYNIDVFENTLHYCNQGIAVGSEKGALTENINIYRNVVSNSYGIGINIADWVDDGLRKNINIYNNTLYNNGQYEYYSGGIKIESSNVEDISILNNICSENLQFEIGVNSDALDEVTVAYNIIDGEQTDELSVNGENYINDSPEFVDAANLDFHLTEDSPAIDAGHPDAQYNDPDGTRNDIGAFYFSQVSSIENPIHNNLRIKNIYPNPTNDIINIELSDKTISDYSRAALLDQSGREILNIKLQEIKCQMNVSEIDYGIYYLKIEDNNYSNTEKIIIY